MKRIKFLIISVILFCLMLASCKKNEDISIKDGDGNIYTSVKIGAQEWLVENLKTTRYNDNTSIPMVSDNNSWSSLTSPAYCWYDNDELANKNTYGALYNLYTVTTGKLCPIGWHVPTDDEWTTLTDFLGGSTGAGGKLKELGTSHWANSNIGATNESGFTALPAGIRYDDGVFRFIESDAGWWSLTEVSASTAYERDVHSINTIINRNEASKKLGLSIRCIKN